MPCECCKPEPGILDETAGKVDGSLLPDGGLTEGEKKILDERNEVLSGMRETELRIILTDPSKLDEEKVKSLYGGRLTEWADTKERVLNDVRTELSRRQPPEHTRAYTDGGSDLRGFVDENKLLILGGVSAIAVLALSGGSSDSGGTPAPVNIDSEAVPEVIEGESGEKKMKCPRCESVTDPRGMKGHLTFKQDDKHQDIDESKAGEMVKQAKDEEDNDD